MQTHCDSRTSGDIRVLGKCTTPLIAIDLSRVFFFFPFLRFVLSADTPDTTVAERWQQRGYHCIISTISANRLTRAGPQCPLQLRVRSHGARREYWTLIVQLGILDYRCRRFDIRELVRFELDVKLRQHRLATWYCALPPLAVARVHLIPLFVTADNGVNPTPNDHEGTVGIFTDTVSQSRARAGSGPPDMTGNLHLICAFSFPSWHSTVNSAPSSAQYFVASSL